jgi:multidrug efflux system membrane fusion protein
VIGGKLVFPGGTVKANDTALAVINRVRPLHVVFALPERHLPRLRAAMAGGGLSARIAVDGNPAHGTDGRVSFIDNAVDPATGTIQLKATLANADEALAPGQFVTVSLALEVLKGVATVPAEAVQQGPHGAFAFVVRDDLGIEQRGVEVIDNRDGMAVIDRGLKEGETVVTDGHLRLTPKSRVQVKQAVTK